MTDSFIVLLRCFGLLREEELIDAGLTGYVPTAKGTELVEELLVVPENEAEYDASIAKGYSDAEARLDLLVRWAHLRVEK